MSVCPTILAVVIPGKAFMIAATVRTVAALFSSRLLLALS
jgi:hypothetical protein